ncbi:MAG: hypothetical protein WC443_10705, partial [Desulfobaccales bacterium]
MHKLKGVSYTFFHVHPINSGDLAMGSSRPRLFMMYMMNGGQCHSFFLLTDPQYFGCLRLTVT